MPPKPDFSALDWLVGEWTGVTVGKDPAGQVHFSAAYDLENRYMVLRENVALPPTKTAPATKESWIGILAARSPKGGGFVLRVFSSTGFVTRYGVSVDEDQIYLNFEGGEEPPPGWLFRRVFEREDDSELSETVRVAPPDKPFFDYYTAKLTRVTSENKKNKKLPVSENKPPKE